MPSAGEVGGRDRLGSPERDAGWSHRISSISVARPSFRTNRRFISEGKAHRRYEFGVEVGIVTALNRPFVLAAHALPNNPCDGHTRVWSLAHTRINTGVPLKTVVVDKGYRGPQVGWPGVEIVRPGQRGRDSVAGMPRIAGGGVADCVEGAWLRR